MGKLILPGQTGSFPVLDSLGAVMGESTFSAPGGYKVTLYNETFTVEVPSSKAFKVLVGGVLKLNVDSAFTSSASPVQALLAGLGVSIVEGPTGTFTVTNTGVRTNTAGTGITLSGTANDPIINNNGVLTLNTRTGAITLAAGSGITITESPTGTFTFSGGTSDPTKLPLAGGTMSGDIHMGGHNIDAGGSIGGNTADFNAINTYDGPTVGTFRNKQKFDSLNAGLEIGGSVGSTFKTFTNGNSTFDGPVIFGSTAGALTVSRTMTFNNSAALVNMGCQMKNTYTVNASEFHGGLRLRDPVGGVGAFLLNHYSYAEVIPTITSTAGAAITYGIRLGHYERLGKALRYYFYIEWTTTGFTGDIRVSLPFTARLDPAGAGYSTIGGNSIGMGGGTLLGYSLAVNDGNQREAPFFVVNKGQAYATLYAHRAGAGAVRTPTKVEFIANNQGPNYLEGYIDYLCDLAAS